MFKDTVDFNEMIEGNHTFNARFTKEEIKKSYKLDKGLSVCKIAGTDIYKNIEVRDKQSYIEYLKEIAKNSYLTPLVKQRNYLQLNKELSKRSGYLEYWKSIIYKYE